MVSYCLAAIFGCPVPWPSQKYVARRRNEHCLDQQIQVFFRVVAVFVECADQSARKDYQTDNLVGDLSRSEVLDGYPKLRHGLKFYKDSLVELLNQSG